MNGILVRVAADQTADGGGWNSPVDSSTHEFVYVAIPENRPNHPGLEKPYTILTSYLAGFGISLPPHLHNKAMHLDPDFSHLTYGDQGERAKQLQTHLKRGDKIIFYSGLADIRNRNQLVYAIIGLYEIDTIVPAANVCLADWDRNAHTRKPLMPNASDIVITALPGKSGRLKRCIPIGEYRARAYRVREDLLAEWGGLSVRDGYIQRSARLPLINNMDGFNEWWERQNPEFMQDNN